MNLFSLGVYQCLKFSKQHTSRKEACIVVILGVFSSAVEWMKTIDFT